MASWRFAPPINSSKARFEAESCEAAGARYPVAMRRLALALLLCSGLAFHLVTSARADDSAKTKSQGTLRLDDSAPTPSPADGYKGVALGGQALPPHPPHLPLKGGPQRVTWSGFQVKDGVPTVFVELTAPPDYTIVDQKGAVVVTLKNTVVPLKNNRRPLRVGAFDTSVTDVETEQKGHDTRVVIHTKGDGAPSHRERVEAAAGGFQLLVIEIPSR